MSKQPGSQSRAVCSLTDLSKVGSATGPQIVTLQSSPWFLLNYSAFSALPTSRPLLPPLLSLFYPAMIWWEDWAITGFHKSLFTQNISWDKSFQWLHWRLSNFTDGKVSRRSFLNILLTLPTLCPRLPRSHCWVWNYFLRIIPSEKKEWGEKVRKTVILSPWLWYKKSFSWPRTTKKMNCMNSKIIFRFIAT